MLTQPVTPEMIAAWQAISAKYRDKIQPNRATGQQLLDYLSQTYDLIAIHDAEADDVVRYSVLENPPLAQKLPIGRQPDPRCFFVEFSGNSKELYYQQEDFWQKQKIFVGIDLASGYFHVEGSGLLWHRLCAMQGLDEADLQNFACVAMYVECMEKLGMLSELEG